MYIRKRLPSSLGELRAVHFAARHYRFPRLVAEKAVVVHAQLLSVFGVRRLAPHQLAVFSKKGAQQPFGFPEVHSSRIVDGQVVAALVIRVFPPAACVVADVACHHHLRVDSLDVPPARFKVRRYALSIEYALVCYVEEPRYDAIRRLFATYYADVHFSISFSIVSIIRRITAPH